MKKRDQHVYIAHFLKFDQWMFESKQSGKGMGGVWFNAIIVSPAWWSEFYIDASCLCQGKSVSPWNLEEARLERDDSYNVGVL